MTREEAIKTLKENYCAMCAYGSQDMDSCDIRSCDNKDAIETLEQTRWIPVSEKLPEENEYIGDICKYYLIQDEYGDMHVAHLSNVGWIPMDSLKAIGGEVIAWMPLPEPYSKEKEETLREKLEGEERGLG